MTQSDACEFCLIVEAKQPARIVFETDHLLAFLPAAPATKGHTLVIPRTHIDNFLELTPPIADDLIWAVVRMGRALRKIFSPDGLNVITSAGEAASQTVMHLHIHLVPRWRGDAVGELWPPKADTSEVVQDEVAESIRGYFSTEIRRSSKAKPMITP